MAEKKTTRSPKTKKTTTPKSAPRRAVIVGGMRTPFVRSFGSFMRLDSVALGTHAVRGLLDGLGVSWKEIDALLWGGVVLPSGAPNLGREIALDVGLPRDVEASTVTRACTSSLYSTTLAAALIERGEADVVIAGGSDSTSNAELKMPQSLMHKIAPVMMSRKSTKSDYLRALLSLDPRKDLLPQRPAVKERSTGELMGEAAERMAQRYQITREAQDALAAQSHVRAAAGIESGRLAKEVAPVSLSRGKEVDRDDIVRGDTSVEKLARLRPAFAKGGTLTAGNSSALTDGAAAVLLMSEEKARALGYDKYVTFRGWSYDAVDPADQMLIGPAISMPKAAAKAGMKRSDIDAIDIHEAFAAQVLCVLEAMGSDAFAREHLGARKAFGAVTPEEINLHGGSISIGHPFGATGARMVTTMANELMHEGKGTALLGICGAGGLSVGAVLERVR